MKKKSLWLAALALIAQAPHAVAYEVEDFDRFLASNECAGCDLSWAPLADKDFTKAKLDGANLRCANLQNTILRMADMAKADLSCANLSFTNFEAADLFKVDLTGAKLEGTIFDGAYLVGAIMDDKSSGIAATNSASSPSHGGAAADKVVSSFTVVAQGETEEVVEVSADKEAQAVADHDGPKVRSQEEMLAELEETNVCIECDFSGMDLAGMKFKWAYLERSTFEGAILNGTRFKGANLKSVSFRNADLREADFRKADLYKADFEGADLAGANFRKASIDGAYMGSANLRDINWEKVRR